MRGDRVSGRSPVRFRWADPRSVCMYNQEGRHQELGRKDDVITTRLVTPEALDRFVAAGQAIRL